MSFDVFSIAIKFGELLICNSQHIIIMLTYIIRDYVSECVVNLHKHDCVLLIISALEMGAGRFQG